MKELINSHL